MADNSGQASRGNGKLTPDHEEIRRLKIENKQLKLERQILKEEAVFFGAGYWVSVAVLTMTMNNAVAIARMICTTSNCLMLCRILQDKVITSMQSPNETSTKCLRLFD